MEDITCVKCGTINEYRLEPSGKHMKAVCVNCNGYIKFVSQNLPQKFYFGKFKDTLVSECEDKQYLNWYLENIQNIKEPMQTAISHRIKELN